MLSECLQLDRLYLDDNKTTALKNKIKSTALVKTVRKFEIDAFHLKQLDEANISIAFDQLDELKINGQLDEGVVRFLNKHPTVSKFRYRSSTINKNLLHHLVKALQSVKQVRMEWYEFSLHRNAEYDALGSKWRSSVTSINKYTSIVKLER